ncbi:hypothetical protein ABVC70_08785 [Hoylesella timonensis]
MMTKKQYVSPQVTVMYVNVEHFVLAGSGPKEETRPVEGELVGFDEGETW